MTRRVFSLVAVLAIVLLSLPGAVAAQENADEGAWITVPEDGVVRGTTTVKVRVQNLLQPVSVRVQIPDVGSHRLSCDPNCDANRNDDGSWRYQFRQELDPRSGAPFAEAGFLNGKVDAIIVVERHLDEQRYRRNLTFHVPSVGVRDVVTSVSGDAVTIGWTRAPEADVTGYRIERVGSTTTHEVATVGPDAASAVDQPGVGDHEYRVVTIRKGGTSPTLETTSSTVSATVDAPPEPETATPGSGGGDGSDGGSLGGASSSGGPRDADAPALDADGDGDDGAAGQDRSQAAASQRSATRTGRSAGRAGAFSFEGHGPGIPAIPAADEVFRGELDYGAREPQTADGDGDGSDVGDDEVVLSTPGRSGGSFLGRLTDPDRVAVPIAGGLLLTAMALHLWRWLKIPLV